MTSGQVDGMARVGVLQCARACRASVSRMSVSVNRAFFQDHGGPHHHPWDPRQAAAHWELGRAVAMVGRNDAHRVRHHHISLVALAEQRFSTLVAQESVPINSDRALLALAVFRLPSGWPPSTRVCCQTSSAHLRSLTSPTAAVYRCWFETVHSSSPRSSSWSSSLRDVNVVYARAISACACGACRSRFCPFSREAQVRRKKAKNEPFILRGSAIPRTK